MIHFKRIAWLIILFVIATPSYAWWDGGHMQIAHIAYKKLTPDAKVAVDRLLKLNPDYSQWIAGVPADRTGEAAFVRASVWADDIKDRDHGYTNDGETPPRSPEAAQNIGYADKRMHKYWHYRDIAFSSDGTELPEGEAVNALSQIKLFLAAIDTTSSVSDDIKSYDLAWLLHLIADIHQPMHAATRVSAGQPQGDRGGNETEVKPATGEVVKLHAYWDRMFGGYVTVRGAILDATARDGLANVSVDPTLAAIVDPEQWVQESFEAAKTAAYAEPVLSGTGAIALTRDYETRARDVARGRAALAAQRLAAVINKAFQGQVRTAMPDTDDTSCSARPEILRGECKWDERGKSDCQQSPVNVGELKLQMKKYYRCAYRDDVTRVLADATAYVEKRAGEVAKPAVVIDIDETALSNWAEIWQDDFGYTGSGPCEMKPDTACGWKAWELMAQGSALEPTLAFFNAVKGKNVSVFFITGRRFSKELQAATESNLLKVGYYRWDGLILRDSDPKCSVADVAAYKQCERQKIADQGYNLIANVGDQWTDLDKDPGAETAPRYAAERNFKVPNPFYFIAH